MAAVRGTLKQIWHHLDVMTFFVSLLIWGSIVIVTCVTFVPFELWRSVLGCVLMGMFYGLSAMTVWCYYKSMIAEPGRIPVGWRPPRLLDLSEEEIAKKVEEYKKMTARDKAGRRVEDMEPEFRYCLHCESFKPERSHHCRDCRRCILMMDHHCPWVNNCVGAVNRKDFVLFLFYATFSQLMAAGLLTWRVVDIIRTAAPGKPFPIFAMLAAVMDFVFLIPVAIAVGGLLWYQVTCVLENLTTIDEYVLEKRQLEAKRLGKKYAWPYNFGWKKNLSSFFGTTPSQWFLPGTGPVADGLVFERRAD